MFVIWLCNCYENMLISILISVWYKDFIIVACKCGIVFDYVAM